MGGLRIWTSGDTLHISNTRENYVPYPTGLKVKQISDTELQLSWTGVSAAVYYNIYVDRVKVGQSNQTNYIYIPNDSSYHIFHVTAVDSNGNESYRSIERLGVVR